jgi:hypothetical protein
MKLVHNVYTKPKTSNERRLSAPSTKIADGILYVKYCTLPYYCHHMEIDLNRMIEGKLLSKYTISKGTKFIFIWKSVKSGWRYRPYLTPKKYKHKGTYWLPSTIRITKKLYGI